MIEAAPWPRFAKFFAWLADRKLRSQFHAAYGRGLDQLLADAPTQSTLVVANHSAWWDGLVAVWLHHHRSRSGSYALMDADNLRRNRFFQRCGAVGVDLTDPRDGARFLRWAARTLRAQPHTLWLFPQGKERPGNPRPLGFEAGAASLSRLLPAARVLPVALDYLFVGSERPSLFISVGDPIELSGDLAQRNQALTCKVQDELDRIQVLVDGGQLRRGAAQDAGFDRLFGKPPTDRADFATRMLNTLVRPREHEGSQAQRNALPRASR